MAYNDDGFNQSLAESLAEDNERTVMIDDARL